MIQLLDWTIELTREDDIQLTDDDDGEQQQNVKEWGAVAPVSRVKWRRPHCSPRSVVLVGVAVDGSDDVGGLLVSRFIWGAGH